MTSYCLHRQTKQQVLISTSIWTAYNALYSVQLHFAYNNNNPKSPLCKITIWRMVFDWTCHVLNITNIYINMRNNGHPKVRTSFPKSVCNLRSQLLVGGIDNYVMKRIRNHDDIQSPQTGLMTDFCHLLLTTCMWRPNSVILLERWPNVVVFETNRLIQNCTPISLILTYLQDIARK